MSWEPHTVVTEEYLDPGPVAALTALLGSGAPAVGPGDPLPPLWHWAALARWPAAAEIGPDGHPRRGSFLPPVELPRRMFAGGEVSFEAPLLVGSTVRREATVSAVTLKRGRSGELVVVVVQITLTGPDGVVAVRERQDLIYREAAAAAGTGPDTPAADPVGVPLLRHGPGDWELRTDPTVLMRFSAVTANAHRIHYDRPYATEVEGYRGLVVHGPLTTLALAETLRVDHTCPPVLLRHRNLAPVFCGDQVRLRSTSPETPPGTEADAPCGANVELVATGASAAPTATDATITHSALTAEFPTPEPKSHA
ncbi:MaoC family dehydratase N-terminal domain-containing protein [Nocardia sp. NPDC057227]|uniref:FAS1-like dehydratase domain-containing protein n=1 Tax=Nocardia sp. NPDC057227 TaxID=3346056 RepID=UPI003645A1EF